MQIKYRDAADMFPSVTQSFTFVSVPITTVNTYYDLTATATYSSGTYRNYTINVGAVKSNAVFTITNLTPSVCSITNWPSVTRLTDGAAQIKLTYRNTSSIKILNLKSTVSNSPTVTNVTGFIPGSLGAYTWDIIKPLLDAKTDQNLLTGGTFDGTNWNFGNATYNTACWASQFDFSGVVHKNSMWNTPHFAGTLITRRHILQCGHYVPTIGTTLTFIARDGTKVTRTVSAYSEGTTGGPSNITSNSVWAAGLTDVCVAVLSSDLPASITSYPIIGRWRFKPSTTRVSSNKTTNYYIQNWIGFRLDQKRVVQLCGRTDTSESTLVTYTAYYSGAANTYTGKSLVDVITSAPNFEWGSVGNMPSFLNPAYASFYNGTPIVGDSCSPRFLPLSSNTMCLVGLVTFSGGNGYVPEEQVVNTLIESADAKAGISTGYKCTIAASPV